MVKLMELVKRRPHVTVDEFRRDALRWHETTSSWPSRPAAYTLSLPPSRDYVRREPVFDAVAEWWFEPDLDYEQPFDGLSPFVSGTAERTLSDFSRSVRFVAEDIEVKAGSVPDGAVKTVVVVHPRPGLAAAEFHRYWRDVHGPIGARLPRLCRYVQSHTNGSVALDGRAVHGCALTWFPDRDSIRSSMQSHEWQALREDEPRFVADDCPFVTTEEVIRELRP